VVRYHRKIVSVSALTAVALAALAGCSGGSSSPSSQGTAGAGGTKTITIGLLTDVTGLAASSSKTSIEGVKAGIAAVAPQGYKIKYVVADTATNPAQVLTAAQKLVQRDHVFAVIAHSALFYAAARYLTQHNVPVVGVAEDGPEWITSKNMFSVYGAIHTEQVTTTFGNFFKAHGVTTVGALGYSISPSSAEAAKGAGVSAKAVGLKSGYIDSSFPFGSTNVQPVAIAMKNGGVDGVTADVDPNTAFALIAALRNLGVDIKAALLPTGYGGDLLQAGPGALKEAQNVFFGLQYEPIEMNTAATKRFVAALTKVGVTTEPTYAEYNGYASILLLVQGLKAAGANPTQASLITALSAIHSFNADGLFGAHPIDINDRTGASADNCTWVTELSGSTFKLVPGADPVCGKVIPGATVSP
jgi:ABC-type branched-subunit amino acid transport system substrate-binding protein